MTDLVSVVIPTRNRADYLPGAVASALAQTHPRLEVVVVDDGSEDLTPELLEREAARDSRIRVVRREEGGGAPRARNAGARAARGSILAFLDDDCVFHPDKTARQLPLLEEGRGVVYCRQMIQQLHGGWEVEGKPGGGLKPLEGLLSIGTNTLLVRREIFEAVGGFDEELTRLQDWELLLRLSRETTFGYLPEILVRGVMVRGGITLTPDPMREAAKRIVSRHFSHLGRGQLGLLYNILGRFLLVDGLTREAREYMTAAVRMDPRSLRNWLGLGISLLGSGPARVIRGWRRERVEEGSLEIWPAEGGDLSGGGGGQG
jgi:glycosyltransferase involved in cell wall biosynthesis